MQGVGFRPFIYRTAHKYSLRGYVQNRADAGVKIVAEGKEENVKRFINEIKESHPPLAKIYDIKVNYENTNSNQFEYFSIQKSSSDTDRGGSIIPPDVSICDSCLAELCDPKNRRHDYFFITCTDCGPRYTTIQGLPYDRPNTTMVDFPMCDDCNREYHDPLNRRFHAQTIACKVCGPKVLLVNRASSPRCTMCVHSSYEDLLEFDITAQCRDCPPDAWIYGSAERYECDDPIREAGKLIEEGYIVAIKGNGGFHIATSTLNDKPLEKLRARKERGNKPFGVMAKDLQTARSFAQISEDEERLLTSYIKPIVLLKKRRDSILSSLIAPDIDRIGTMLPYTGMHAMLFDRVREPAFVMTSANPPNEPIITENSLAMKKLKDVVDFFLIHNRKIAQRADDSVIRMHGKNPSIIRRSRGFAPQPIHLVKSSKKSILSLGAELNVTSCIISNDKAIISQHIGDIEKYETLEFLKDATEHLIKLTNAKIDLVACDLHPSFNTTQLAKEFANRFHCPLVRVQHHSAHISSLMGEYGLGKIIGIAADGYGYGSDGSAWGGEILYCNDGLFERVAHLQDQPLVGGDLATRYPLRMVAAILKEHSGINEWLSQRADHFQYGKRELDVILKEASSRNLTKTSSLGRILDTISALLDICYKRTYEGEPAMRLESVASNGKDVLHLEPQINNGILETTFLLKEIFENRKNYSITDLASSAQSYLARGVAQLAVSKAKMRHIDSIGFSGGVAHNESMTNIIRSVVEGKGLKFYVHNQIPPGDGGISFGQAVAASKLVEKEIRLQELT
ncbi:MAG: carbamoyltransferase HypF [Patescibacteria group bacterium]|nr:carbamoyltransferase HypF [Patescibacteria group bacterium]